MSHNHHSKSPVNLVLCWHMHQPQYQDQFTRQFSLPWTYLHAIKDYTDMAAAVEQVPQSRVVVNFTPVLLEQIDDYTAQFTRFYEYGEPFNDPLLQALSAPTIGPTPDLRQFIVNQCIRANEQRLVHRFKAYSNLVTLAKQTIQHPSNLTYLDEQFFFDLLVWYHLVWMGETVRQESPVIQRLIQKKEHYRFSDRKELLNELYTLLNGIIPRYRHLAESGQVELSVTPDKHPILPLLLDFQSTREAMSDAALPTWPHYPGGKERANRHLQTGLAVFEKHFGFRPVGCWPSEGSISNATLALLQEAGFLWTASGGGVLSNTKMANEKNDICIHKAFQHDYANIRCFYRDDNLSDLIGFTYSGWQAKDAVDNLVHHILNIQAACDFQQDTIVPIILDGENCWEYYQNNGNDFLKQLYATLAEHPAIRMTTFQDYLKKDYAPTRLQKLVSGSWVYGTFSTWIGDPAKNRAWDLLCQAKSDFDRVLNLGHLDADSIERAEQQLAICEGSDWFWWFGDYNASESVQDFDRLYRTHLKNLYRFLGEPYPSSLDQVISQGGGNPENSGTMRRGQG